MLKIFSWDPGNLSTHFCKLNCSKTKPEILQSNHFEVSKEKTIHKVRTGFSEEKTTHKVWNKEVLSNPLTKIEMGEKKKQKPIPTQPLVFSWNPLGNTFMRKLKQ